MEDSENSWEDELIDALKTIQYEHKVSPSKMIIFISTLISHNLSVMDVEESLVRDICNKIFNIYKDLKKKRLEQLIKEKNE